MIDTHVHLYPPDVVRDWENIAAREPRCGAVVHGGGRVCTAEELLEEMTAEGVAEGWLCGFGFSDLGLCRACNEYAFEAARNSGGRLRWLCAVPPAARGAVAEVERCAALGAVGVGELCPDAQGWEADERRETWRIAAVCHEQGLYLLVNAAEKADKLYAFARNHPELVIAAACMGGGLFLRESVKDARDDLRNVYYDTGSAPLVYGGPIFEAGFGAAPRKIVFGSNFPDRRAARCRAALGETRLTDEDRDRLFHQNARDLLRLARSGRDA